MGAYPSRRRRRTRGAYLAACGAAAIALTAAACSSGSSGTNGAAAPTGGTPVSGGTATYALPPSTTPNYIFPLAGRTYFSVSNLSQFQFLMYRPLYWFGQNGQCALNNSLSLADPPVYSSDGKSVTITLKGWKWSDGTQITARDVQFWQNLVHCQQGQLGRLLARRVSRQRHQHHDQPDQPAADHLQPHPGVRLVLLHLQRAEPDHPAPPARLGQGARRPAQSG